jgi:hypothetical protein
MQTAKLILILGLLASAASLPIDEAKVAVKVEAKEEVTTVEPEAR